MAVARKAPTVAVTVVVPGWVAVKLNLLTPLVVGTEALAGDSPPAPAAENDTGVPSATGLPSSSTTVALVVTGVPTEADADRGSTRRNAGGPGCHSTVTVLDARVLAWVGGAPSVVTLAVTVDRPDRNDVNDRLATPALVGTV